jgi:7-cyano-7-deazaguanine reductase
MEKFDTLDKAEAVRNLEERIRDDLSTVLNTNTVKTKFYDGDKQKNYENDYFTKLEDTVRYTELSFTQYNESPDTLQFQLDDLPRAIAVRSSLLRSNCRVTNQPDWGDIYIYLEGDKLPTHESILQYIVSLRSENHFHEEICECVYKRLFDKFAPDGLAVACFYTRRGGIDINPIRATSPELEKSLFGTYANLGKIVKTVRQ